MHLEAEDDGPDESERESVVAVDDVMWPHVLQVHPLLLEELQGFVHVLQAVDTHAALRWLGLRRDQIMCMSSLDNASYSQCSFKSHM